MSAAVERDVDPAGGRHAVQRLAAFRIAIGGFFGQILALAALLVTSAGWSEGPDPAAEEVWLLVGFVVGASRAAIEQLWGTGRSAIALAIVLSAVVAPGLVASVDEGACGGDACGTGQTAVLVAVIAVGSAVLSLAVLRVLDASSITPGNPSELVTTLVIVGAASLIVMQRLRVGPAMGPPLLPALAVGASSVLVVAEVAAQAGRRHHPAVRASLTVVWVASALWLWSAAW